MSKKDASPIEVDDSPDIGIKITLNALINILARRFPQTEITIIGINGVDYSIDITGSDNEEADGCCFYDSKAGFAYSFSDNWFEMLLATRECLLDHHLFQQEREAIRVMDADKDLLSDEELARFGEEDKNLFSEAQYRAEKRLD